MTEPDDRRRDETLDDLIGAYALDALDTDERERVERYLAINPAARHEADRLAQAIDEVAASDDAAAEPADDLWDRIAAALPPHPERVPATETTPAAPAGPGGSRSVPVDDLAVRRARRSPRRTVLALVAAAAVVVIVLAGVVAVHRAQQPTSSVAARLEADADRVAGEPGSRSGTLTGPQGTSVRVVVDADGRGFIVPTAMPALQADQTYQLWSMDNGTPISLGLLGSDPTVAVVGASGHPEQLAITVEPAGGSPGPTSNPVAVGTLS